MNLTKGQKADLTKNRNLTELKLDIEWTAGNAEMEIDGAAFLLSERGVCEQDEDFVFYGHPAHESGAVRHEGKEDGRRERLTLVPASIPPEVSKIALTLTIYEGEENGHFFRDVSEISIRCTHGEGGEELLRYAFGADLDRETAIVVAEIYRHNGEWKFAAIGSGYNGGLAALCESYGLEVGDGEEEAEPSGHSAPEPEAPVQPPQPSVVPDASAVREPKPGSVDIAKPVASKVMLEKIELKKPGSVSIRKSSSALASLVWENPRKDLDLYCFYVTKEGQCGKVYYKDRGSSQKAPYIELDKDARGAGEETIRIYRTDELKYVLFCAYSAVSNGFGSFKGMKARAVVDNGEGQSVESWLQKKNIFSYWVAIAKIDFTGEDRMEVSQVENYSKGGVENSPLLYADGSFKMDVGPIEFKGR
ncbi:TerD family protein [Saccharibacillus sp. CPCC 101409]|uniref:TerD family protein n=1 Tax=Saccharibacillus sp. CPCC 101409 TaxID=3058041 RepID=UPI0026726A20|nr:TerD family protein [Saccharibacillus sp. CPCC 101409]MDO3411612.1 TerD family protein [Saccharibacillus sp. CPCC 101409]